MTCDKHQRYFTAMLRPEKLKIKNTYTSTRKRVKSTFDMSLLFNIESFAVSFVRGAFLVLLISCTKARIRC